ncbi:unnamed protein product [Malassezia sympodialis ATCC 42132]|uniref:uncharacterized protein n=1 Tax=Malassezia sympodialis (strain ATCC 42132) TaxID=1230383 RepID=UPI0002C2B742|nr:uncharacterized protein MSY001_2186 [Malassezia sympodialis ATCC 42132]CCU99480.1 unnamed protein product [Malassezia sympodialis ATCC 42132]|eukprot:XP_018740725.1 uncharacterized protein MSY001_2186 [Malassezia sympodialis ATCC 42132]
MAYVRGTQAPMDLTEPGPRQRALCTLTAASIFDAPMDTATPDASLMDLDPDSPAVEPPSSAPPVTMLGAPPPAERSIQPAPAIQEVGSDGGHLMLRPAPGSPHVRAPEPSEPVPLPKRTAPSVLERPELLLTYAQVLFNASIIFVFLYLLFSLVWTIQRDVSQKVREYELAQAPALSELCESWKRCSARDPTVVGRARVTAETFAEILNGFVDAVSWKTMLFSLLTLSIVVGATNSTLSFFRVNARHAHEAPLPEAAYASAYPPYALPPDWDGRAPLRRRVHDESATIPYRANES